nr:dnaJ homolog subfamily B member 2-like isoform X2 [Pogona vitticeps]
MPMEKSGMQKKVPEHRACLCSRMNSTMVNYYQVLDIPQTASSDDIKKVYRQHALKWHPDKNPENKEYAEKKFKEIAEAYEVLSDSKRSELSFHFPIARGYKRDLYDLYGLEGLMSLSTGPGLYQSLNGTPDLMFTFRDADEVFREAFEGQDPFTENLDLREGLSQWIIPGESTYSYYSYTSPTQTDFFTTFGPGAELGIGFNSISTSTKYINGKRITTRRILEHGQERLEIDENGELKVAEEQDFTNNLKDSLEHVKQEQPEVLSSATDIRALPRPQSVGPALASCPENEEKELHRAMAYSLSEMENVGQNPAISHGSKKRRGSLRQMRKRLPGASEEALAAPWIIQRRSPGAGDNTKEKEDKPPEDDKVGGSKGEHKNQPTLSPEENDAALRDMRYVFPDIIPSRRERDSILCAIL